MMLYWSLSEGSEILEAFAEGKDEFDSSIFIFNGILIQKFIMNVQIILNKEYFEESEK